MCPYGALLGETAVVRIETHAIYCYGSQVITALDDILDDIIELMQEAQVVFEVET